MSEGKGESEMKEKLGYDWAKDGLNGEIRDMERENMVEKRGRRNRTEGERNRKRREEREEDEGSPSTTAFTSADPT